METIEADLQLSEKHAAALERVRGLSSEIAASQGVVTMPDGRMAFEYRHRDVLLYRKVISKKADGSRTFSRDRKGVKSCLWGIDTLQGATCAVITEGEFDRLAMLTAGVNFAVSVPDGAQLAEPGRDDIEPWHDKAFDWLWDDGQLIEELRDLDRIVLATDNDAKGRVLAGELAVRLGRDRCWMVRYPTGNKDTNDVLMGLGAEAVRAMVDGAAPVVPDRLVPASAFDDLQEPDSLTFEARGLSGNLKPLAPELMVVTGPPNHGKSQFVLWLAASIVRDHGARVAYLQFEDNPTRNISDLTRYAVSHVDGIQHTSEAKPWVENWFRFICPSEQSEYDLTWLEDVIRTAAVRNGCKVVIIDPWNEIEHVWDRHETASSYLNRALRQLKRVARQYRICLIIVAHPDKQSGQSTDIDDWSLYSIDGGAAWNNKADHGVIVLMRPATEEVLIKVCKSKDWDRMGRPGLVTMRYNRGRAAYAVDTYSGPELAHSRQ